MQDGQEKTKVKKEKKQKPEIRKGPMTKEEWERIEKTRKVKVLPDIDSKRLHYDENKSKVQDEYSFVLTGSPPPPHVRAAYKSFKKPQGFWKSLYDCVYCILNKIMCSLVHEWTIFLQCLWWSVGG